MTSFLETRERLQFAAASLFVNFAAALLTWQDPVSATCTVLHFLTKGMRRIILNHRAALPTL